MYEIDGLIFNTQEEYREYLKTSEDHWNTYQKWTKEEDIELQKLSKNKSVEELCHHFKRVKGSITSRLQKLQIIKEEVNKEDTIETSTESSKLISLDLEISELSQDDTSSLVEDIKEYLNTISKINRFGVRISNLGGKKIHKNKKGIIKSIKDELKIKHKVELVLIQVGYYIEIIEEDSEFFHEKFGFIIHNGGGTRSYNVSGFPVSVLEKYVGELEDLGVNFCVCEQVQDNLSNSVTRRVTYSSINKNILNLIF